MKSVVRSVIVFSALLLAACGPDKPQPLTDQEIHQLIIATSINKNTDLLWANSIRRALEDMKLPVNKQNSCASIAVIEQESSFVADPPVPGIANMLRKKLDKASENIVIGQLINMRLDSLAKNGKSFRENIRQIKTEGQLGVWYEEFTASSVTFPILTLLNKDLDSLISTVGSMQVSVEFAREYAREHDLPDDNLRQHMFTIEGGVYYGIAHLLNGGQHYPDMVFYFADFNAGHFASRNAGFQAMVAKLAGKKIAEDGDLINYSAKNPAAESETFQATLLALKKHGVLIDQAAIEKDFKLTKKAKFAQTNTYAQIKQLYEVEHGTPIEAKIPTIRLESEKITRKLTTKWFAERVKGRYKKCMKA